MLTRFGFKQPQNCPGGCNQLRIIPNPLNGPDDGGAIHIQSTGHLAPADRQILGGNMPDPSASLGDLKTVCRAGQSLFVDVKIRADGGDHPR